MAEKEDNYLPLSIDNICGQLVVVNAERLGRHLRVPSKASQQKRDTVEYWLSVDPTPSWRRLLWALDCSGQKKAVHKVMACVESLTDPSLTAEKVSSVLESLSNWGTVCLILSVPVSRQDLIMGEYFTNKQRKEAAVDWWLQYSPDASWARLAGELYYNNETTALEAVSQYIPKDSADSSLTVTNLWPALDGVSNWWDHLGLCDCLQVPKSVQQEIQQQTSNVTQQKKTLLERWLHDHPASSWAVVAEALYWMEEHDVLEQVKKMYIITDSCHSEDTGLMQIDFSDLKFGDEMEVGKGTAVYKGEWTSRNLIVAIKQVAGRIRVEEAEIHSQMHHPNVIELHGVVQMKPDYYLVLGFAEGGSLYNLLHKQHYYPDFAQTLKWAKEIAEGMKYLHQKKVIHRDLKSPNVLLTGDLSVKLCDFGLAKEFDVTKPGTQVGTYRWMAPEVMKKEPVSLSCDVFSYGMVLLELLTGDLPFPGLINLIVIRKIMEGETPTVPDVCEPFLECLLKRCWSTNPKDRPGFSEILTILESGHTEEAELKEIDFTDLEFGDELETGAGTAVYKGQWISKNLVVAIKQVTGKIKEEEAKIHSQLRHPNVIRLHGIVKRRPDFYLIMEFAEQGSLYDLLHKQHYHPDFELRLKWAKEIAKGMSYLHQKKIIHRDLKSPNVLLTADLTVKLCDFGISKEFVSTKPGTEVGTYRWMAPEVMKKEPVSLSCDVFSYGMMLLEILTCELPFAEVTADLSVAAKIMNGETPPVPNSCDPDLTHLLESCWRIIPKERPSFSEILSALANKPM